MCRGVCVQVACVREGVMKDARRTIDSLSGTLNPSGYPAPLIPLGTQLP